MIEARVEQDLGRAAADVLDDVQHGLADGRGAGWAAEYQIGSSVFAVFEPALLLHPLQERASCVAGQVASLERMARTSLAESSPRSQTISMISRCRGTIPANDASCDSLIPCRAAPMAT